MWQVIHIKLQNKTKQYQSQDSILGAFNVTVPASANTLSYLRNKNFPIEWNSSNEGTTGFLSNTNCIFPKVFYDLATEELLQVLLDHAFQNKIC